MTEETAQRIALALEALVALKEREETRDLEHMLRGEETLRLNRELKERLDGAVKRSAEESTRAEERAARWEAAAGGIPRRVEVPAPVVAAFAESARCKSCGEVWPGHAGDCLVRTSGPPMGLQPCKVCGCYLGHTVECQERT